MEILTEVLNDKTVNASSIRSLFHYSFLPIVYVSDGGFEKFANVLSEFKDKSDILAEFLCNIRRGVFVHEVYGKPRRLYVEENVAKMLSKDYNASHIAEYIICLETKDSKYLVKHFFEKFKDSEAAVKAFQESLNSTPGAREKFAEVLAEVERTLYFENGYFCGELRGLFRFLKTETAREIARCFGRINSTAAKYFAKNVSRVPEFYCFLNFFAKYDCLNAYFKFLSKLNENMEKDFRDFLCGRLWWSNNYSDGYKIIFALVLKELSSNEDTFAVFLEFLYKLSPSRASFLHQMLYKLYEFAEE